MLSSIQTAFPIGISAIPVKVEVDVQGNGLPQWRMVGLLETTVKESKERVTSALRNSGFIIPNRKTTVSLHPAGLKKAGAGFDLPIALGLLSAWEKRSCSLPYLVAGELSLTGELLPTPGILLLSLLTKELNLKGIIVPSENAKEASLVEGIEIIGANDLKDVANFVFQNIMPIPKKICVKNIITNNYDMCDVRGQESAKRGLEVAASGNHHLLMIGSPGTGKSMLAGRLPSILPKPNKNEELEIMKILSATGTLSEIPPKRPFRSPHHSASYAGLVGGGAGIPSIGEISLAHNGVLFLDELGEFKRDVLEMIREPMESGTINISRSGITSTHPAKFMLVAATNPCKCGYLGHPRVPCNCTIAQIHSYRTRLSGPLLDRIDIHLEIPPFDHKELWAKEGEASVKIRERVERTRIIQYDRFGCNKTNSQMDTKELHAHCHLEQKEKRLLCDVADKLALSARSISRIIKVARTIADMDTSEQINEIHIDEALSYRTFDQVRM